MRFLVLLPLVPVVSWVSNLKGSCNASTMVLLFSLIHKLQTYFSGLSMSGRFRRCLDFSFLLFSQTAEILLKLWYVWDV